MASAAPGVGTKNGRPSGSSCLWSFNLPEDLLRALREVADKDRRSLTREIIHLLELALRGRGERPTLRASGADAQLAAWRKLAGKWESDVGRATEAERFINRRTSGR